MSTTPPIAIRASRVPIMHAMPLFMLQPKDRQELVDTFQSNPSVRVALLGLTAAGIGITLTAASRCKSSFLLTCTAHAWRRPAKSRRCLFLAQLEHSTARTISDDVFAVER